MKYMSWMHAPKGKGDWEIFNWPPQDFKAYRLHAPRKTELRTQASWWRRGLDRTGQGPARAGRQRRSAVTDGVFPQTKDPRGTGSSEVDRRSGL